jgi:flagellar basal body-associated protein FliL
MSAKNKDRTKKQKKARENNVLEKTVTPEKRKHGRRLIVLLVGMTILAAGLVIYLQSY